MVSTFQLTRPARLSLAHKNKANSEMRNMRSDDDLSHYGSGIGQESKPTFTVCSSPCERAKGHVTAGQPVRRPELDAPYRAVYTDGHSLEIGPKILTFSAWFNVR
jgi:hypothetical protein